jgi:amino acid adenylation domain-containing protein
LAIDAAAEHPDRDAVVADDGRLRYADLDRQAGLLAGRLRGRGVRPGDRVVIWSGKSVATVVAMQAVLRLGAAYVPADATAPPARVETLARDCAARLVLAAAERLPRLAEDIPAFELAPGRGSDAEPGSGSGSYPGPGSSQDPRGDRINEPVRPDDLAYILYTSGSTGTPKGVSISHRNALAFIEWAVEELGAGPDDRFSNHAPFTFDLSVLDLYAAFAVGAAVHLVPSDLAYAPAGLAEFLHRRRITVWYSVPSALTLMMREGGLLQSPAPPQLRAILFAGEPFPIAWVRQLAAWTDARLLNLYGPTETNVCTFHEVRPPDLLRDRPVPIGTPCSGDKAWARRADGAVCGPGEQGELIVEGPTVMLGYWGRPREPEPYPTGDIVTVLPDGAFDYVGRRDHQVKIRGHRVELGEVEAALTAHPGVAEAAAVVRGVGVDAHLVACVIAHEPAERRPGNLELRRHCAERLPRYLVPDEIRLLTDLPRTATGKVDRTTLAARLDKT